MDFAFPQSKISFLSSYEFVGMVTDDPEQKIKLKAFHCEIVNNNKGLVEEEKSFKNLSSKNSIDANSLSDNYLKIKTGIAGLVEAEIERLLALSN
jgi:hypothetical protein